MLDCLASKPKDQNMSKSINNTYPLFDKIKLSTSNPWETSRSASCQRYALIKPLDFDSERKLRHIHYFMHTVNLLHLYKITPVVVFYGCNVPCKALTKEQQMKEFFFVYLF